MFETIIQGQASEQTGRKRTVLISLTIHIFVLGVLIVIPLIYYQTIPGGWEFVTDAFAGKLPDPVPPSPPPPARPASGPRIPTTGAVVIRVPDLIEPTNVPPPPDAVVLDLPLGALGGDGSGSPGPLVPYFGDGPVVIPNVLRPTRPPVPPPPPPKAAKHPMLISSLDPSRLIFRVEPVYPYLAIQTRVQGQVMLQVTVNEMGVVESVEVVSGHPLLVKAAVEAVKQWRYKPTILNGEPVPVKATVTVNFNLRR